MIGVHAGQTAHRVAGRKVQHADDALAGDRLGGGGAAAAAATVIGVPADRQVLDEADAFGQLDLLLLGEILDRPADGRRRIVDGLLGGVGGHKNGNCNESHNYRAYLYSILK